VKVNFERAFDQNCYVQNYRNYDLQNPLKKIVFYRELVERWSNQGSRILEIGCGFGKFLSILGPKWERYGLDVSEFAIGRASALVPDARFCVSNATEIPFEGLFDVIAAFDVVEHIEDLNLLARTLSSRLTQRGRFIFVLPVYDGASGLVVRALDKDKTHVHKMSRWFWLDWASRNFRLDEWIGIFRVFLPTGNYVHKPTTRFKVFSPAVAIVASKLL
jgi:SAM-dependent methyltransferase